MSKQIRINRTTVPQIVAKKGQEPIVALTSYHAHTAAIVDKYADCILVGDSLGMVMHGMESTVRVPLDLMIMHGKAVVRGTENRKSTRLNSSHVAISYAVFCLKKKKIRDR